MFMAGNRKQETRQRIVKAADRSFRCHGYAGVGVDGIAREAGVTSGAFYAHLGSKDQAFVAALDISLSEALADLPKFRRDYGSNWVKAFAEYYLGQAHRADLACGCAMTSLSPEVVRFDDRVRALYEKKMSAIVDMFANGLAGGSLESRRSRAWATLSTLIGGLILARGMKSRKAAEMIAAGVKAAAIAAAGECAS
jgi:TetR/AcrR family transcriptional regulator, transcriptional repressor for nem operon